MPLEVNLSNAAKWAKCFDFGNSTPLNRLAAGIFVGSDEPRWRLMALFSAYFDASGNAIEQPFVVVSGYIANFQQWKLLEDCWKNTHAKYGVSLPFHAADLAAAISNPNYKGQHNARQDYVALANDPDRA